MEFEVYKFYFEKRNGGFCTKRRTQEINFITVIIGGSMSSRFGSFLCKNKEKKGVLTFT